MRLLPVLPVVLALTVVALVRPDLLTAAAGSPKAWLVAAGVAIAAFLTRLGVRRWSPTAAPWAGSAMTLALLGVLLIPSFRDTTVNEQFPPVDALSVSAPDATAATGSDPATATLPPSAPAATVATAPVAPSPARATSAAVAPAPSQAPVATKKAVAPRPAATNPPAATTSTAKRLSTGQFEGINHRASGRASLYSYEGDVLVRFEGIDFAGNPDPEVYLVPKGSRSISGGIHLGGLKANNGSFSYTVKDLDVTKEWTVFVWCETYDTPIAAADQS